MCWRRRAGLGQAGEGRQSTLTRLSTHPILGEHLTSAACSSTTPARRPEVRPVFEEASIRGRGRCAPRANNASVGTEWAPPVVVRGLGLDIALVTLAILLNPEHQAREPALALDMVLTPYTYNHYKGD